MPEGTVWVYVGGTPKDLVDLDIKWSKAETEVGNHPGKLEWKFRPEVGQLSITLKLDNVKLNYKSQVATATVNEMVKPPGTYKPVL
jgi:hypothetical protein